MFHLEMTKTAVYAHITLTQTTRQKHKLSLLTGTSLLHQVLEKVTQKHRHC